MGRSGSNYNISSWGSTRNVSSEKVDKKIWWGTITKKQNRDIPSLGKCEKTKMNAEPTNAEKKVITSDAVFAMKVPHTSKTNMGGDISNLERTLRLKTPKTSNERVPQCWKEMLDGKTEEALLAGQSTGISIVMPPELKLPDKIGRCSGRALFDKTVGEEEHEVGDDSSSSSSGDDDKSGSDKSSSPHKKLVVQKPLKNLLSCYGTSGDISNR